MTAGTFEVLCLFIVVAQAAHMAHIRSYPFSLCMCSGHGHMCSSRMLCSQVVLAQEMLKKQALPGGGLYGVQCFVFTFSECLRKLVAGWLAI